MPTSSPSVSSGTLWLDELTAFQSSIAADAYSFADSHVFTTVTTAMIASIGQGGAPLPGSCSAWSGFWSASAPVAVADARLSRLGVYLGTQVSRAGSVYASMCTDVVAVDAIIGSLVEGTDTRVTCDATTWLVRVCADGSKAVCAAPLESALGQSVLSCDEADPCAPTMDDESSGGGNILDQRAWVAPCASPSHLSSTAGGSVEWGSGAIAAFSVGFDRAGLVPAAAIAGVTISSAGGGVGRESLTAMVHVDLTAANKRGSAVQCAAVAVAVPQSSDDSINSASVAVSAKDVAVFHRTLDFTRIAGPSLTAVPPPPPGQVQSNTHPCTSTSTIEPPATFR